MGRITFLGFADISDSEIGTSFGDDMVSGTFGGMTFTLSAPASAVQ
ncbi:MAG: hypothetical protein P8Q99_09845 [Paracoccaceae bacterium]|nr:hypothetical protein [Paracoccaceae bacterium]